MDLMVWFFVASIAFFWGGYPILTRFAPMHPAWTAALLVNGAAIIGSIGLFAKPTAPGLKNSAITLIAGAMLGAGMFLFSKLLAWEGLEIGKVFAICAALGTVVSAVGGMIFLGESIAPVKIAGLVAIGIGIYLLD